MNRILKTILIISITVFGTCFLPTNFSQAQTPPNIVVEIWKVDHFELLGGNPIFDVSNFLPGETQTERIRVTNNTSQSQTVGLKVINFDRGCIDSYCLADKLYLTVKPPGNSSLYSGSLTDFYEAGEIPLSGVSANGGNVQYDLSVNFDKDTAAKEYQGSTTDFDLEIGFFTKETVSEEPFSGGGGYTPPISGVVTTITISGPTTLTFGSATVSLTTDIASYCRIIYATTSHPTLGNPPNYGYASSTSPTEKDASHDITLIGLQPDTVYFYRAVCWASPFKISQEHSFTTLASVPTSGSEETVSISEEPASNSTSASVSSSSTSTSTLTPTSGSISIPTPTPTNQESGQVAGEKKEAGEETPVFSPSQENSVGQERGILETPEQIESEESANSIFWLLLLILGMSLGLFVLLSLVIAKFRKKIS